jgi:hypothetical protein
MLFILHRITSVKKVNLFALVLIALFSFIYTFPAQAKTIKVEAKNANPNLVAGDWFNPRHANPCSNWFTCATTVFGAGQWLFDEAICGRENHPPCSDTPPTVGNQDGDNSENCDDQGRCTSRANSCY